MVTTGTTPAAEPLTPQELRQRMVEELRGEGVLDDPALEGAFGVVPREIFLPAGIEPEAVYCVHRAVETGHDEHGRRTASITAPYIHAGMLAQARITPGMRVLEIGSGGPNAAMLAHLVGEQGQVVTVDVDPQVTARTRTGMEQLGLQDRVEVVTADATGELELGIFDRVIVTMAVSDIPEAWLQALVPDGVIVVPLRTGPRLQRVLGFERHGDHLAATSVVWAGFTLARAGGAHAHTARILHGPSGGEISFTFEDDMPGSFTLGDDTLLDDPVHAWSGVEFGQQETWIDLLAYLTTTVPGAVTIWADEPADLGDENAFLAGIVHAGSFAVLTRRQQGREVELGAVGKGPDADRLTAWLCAAIRNFDRRHRGLPVGVDWWPAACSLPHRSAGRGPAATVGVTVLQREHGTAVLHWPWKAPDPQPRAARQTGSWAPADIWHWRSPQDSRRRAWSPDAPPHRHEGHRHRRHLDALARPTGALDGPAKPPGIRPGQQFEAAAHHQGRSARSPHSPLFPASYPGNVLLPSSMSPSPLLAAASVARWGQLEEAFAANQYSGHAALLEDLLPVTESLPGVFTLAATARPDTVVTAVHGTNQLRDGHVKLADRGTGGLALLLAEATGCGAVVTLDDGADANHDQPHPAKDIVAELEAAERVIDLHGASHRPNRPALGLGAGDGRVPERFVAALLHSLRITAGVDDRFTADNPRRLTAFAQRAGLLAVQVEIDAHHRLPAGRPGHLQQLANALHAALQTRENRTGPADHHPAIRRIPISPAGSAPRG